MTVLSQFTCYTFLIYYRFKILNDQLIVYKALYSEVSPSLKRKISDSIRVCCCLHERLTISSRLLNKAFDIQLSATFVTIFWFVVPVLNVLLRDDNIMQALNYSLLNAIKIVILLIGVLLVALVCTKTQNKARKTSLLLTYIAKEEFRKAEANYVHTKCIQMSGRRLLFTACGTTTIDLPMTCNVECIDKDLCVIMFVSITTYLIILNQFTFD